MQLNITGQIRIYIDRIKSNPTLYGYLCAELCRCRLGRNRYPSFFIVLLEEASGRQAYHKVMSVPLCLSAPLQRSTPPPFPLHVAYARMACIFFLQTPDAREAYKREMQMQRLQQRRLMAGPHPGVQSVINSRPALYRRGLDTLGRGGGGMTISFITFILFTFIGSLESKLDRIFACVVRPRE